MSQNDMTDDCTFELEQIKEKYGVNVFNQAVENTH